MAIECIGTEAATGRQTIVRFDRAIQLVDALIRPSGDAPMLSPGWIDLQVNGFAGVDYNSPASTHEQIAASIRALFATGVTRFFPTVITGSPENMAGSLRNLARAKASLPEGPAMEGFHVEGPHISPEDGPRGAHPKEWVRPPDLDEYKRWQDAAEGSVRLVTVSPEWPGITAYIERLTGEGIVVSIGHTKATTEQIADAVRAGASMSTHLGNGAHYVLPRHRNYILDQLAEDKLAAGFIVDGIHLSDSFLRVALRTKGLERSILVTDAVMPAGSAPGRYRLGGVDVEMHADNRVTLVGDERLAGSALSMDRGVENLIRIGGLTLAQALTLVTRNPARVARIAGRQKGLEPGERADLVLFRFDETAQHIEVEQTYLGGELVYAKN